MAQSKRTLTPRIAQGDPMLVAGLREHYAYEARHNIPAQWARFAPRIGSMPGRIGRATFGISSGMAQDGFDYMCGVQVSDLDRLPADLAHMSIPERRFAVFAHEEHVSKMPETMDAIWREWLPKQGMEGRDVPFVVEVYEEAFDRITGMGGMEIWLPIKE